MPIETRAPLRFAGGVVVALGVLVAAACAAHSGFSPIPGSETAGAALRSTAVSRSIPLIANSRQKSGFHVQLSIAGTKTRSFLFDTGSGGLWVYANAIASPKQPVRDLHIEVQNTYGSGLHYDGEAVETAVDFGNGLSANNVPLVRVDNAYCVTSGCKALYGTGNVIRRLESERGLWGTLGADIEPKPISAGGHKSDLYNVLFALGRAWTRFAVTPTDVEASPSMTGFTTIAMTPGPVTNGALPNGAKSWMRDVPVCFKITDSGTIYSGCAATLFDTGAEVGITFQTTAAARIPVKQTAHCGRILAPGKTFSASTAGSHGELLADFKSGVTQNWNEVRITTPAPSASPQVNTGITFYNRNEIGFDAVRGRVGLRPLDPPAHNFQTNCNRD
jgi:hypothetical protein